MGTDVLSYPVVPASRETHAYIFVIAVRAADKRLADRDIIDDAPLPAGSLGWRTIVATFPPPRIHFARSHLVRRAVVCSTWKERDHHSNVRNKF